MDERLAIYLDHMAEAAAKATRMTSGMTRAEFLADEKTQLAVAMCFVVLGEFGTKISAHFPEFVGQHTDWPWSGMRAMRNVAAHSYARVDFEQVWKTVTDSIPDLLARIDELGPLDPRV